MFTPKHSQESLGNLENPDVQPLQEDPKEERATNPEARNVLLIASMKGTHPYTQKHAECHVVNIVAKLLPPNPAALEDLEFQ